MKTVSIYIIVAGLIISGYVFLLAANQNSQNTDTAGIENEGNNVSIVDDKQIIDITARGGYSPRLSAAKADTPTTLRVKTKGTFDCSAALVIPSLDYRVNLPPSDTTEIEIPAQAPGTTLQGLCAMGMYNFQIDFN